MLCVYAAFFLVSLLFFDCCRVGVYIEIEFVWPNLTL
jgi:hypothetical protein